MLYHSNSPDDPYAEATTGEASASSVEEPYGSTASTEVADPTVDEAFANEEPVHDSSPSAAEQYFGESSVAVPATVESTNGSSDRVPVSEVAHQLTALAQTLTHGLEELEEEHRESLEQIRRLEELHQQALSQISALEEMRQQALDQVRALEETHRQLQPAGSVSEEDVETLQGVATSLVENPHHIVFLAKVSEHASTFAAMVEDYARMRRVLTQE